MGYGKWCMMMAILCGLTSAAHWHDPLLPLGPGSHDIDSIPQGVLSSYVHVRMASTSAGSEARWRLEWGRTGTGDYAEAYVEMPPLTNYTGLYPSDAKVTIRLWRDGQLRWETKEKMSADSRFFSLKLIYDGVGMRLYGGTEEQRLLGQIPMIGTSGRVSVDTYTSLLCQRTDCRYVSVSQIQDTHIRSTEKLDEYLAQSTDPIEGKWQYLDRDIDQSRASLGGKYTVAVVKNPDMQRYDILYLQGADKERDKWQAMQLKGYLTPTIYECNYNLWWIDSRGRVLDDDNNAELNINGNMLVLRFPIYKSQLRLSRIP